MDGSARDSVVLASADGTDRLLRLLAQHPRRVLVVDRRPIRLHLARLVLAALKALGHPEFLELMGMRPSKRRRALYARVRWLLPRETDEAWLASLSWIDRGLARESPGARAQPAELPAATFEAAKDAAGRADVESVSPDEAIRRLPDGCVDLIALGTLDVAGLERELFRILRRKGA